MLALMTSRTSLYQRRRPALPEEIAGIPWMPSLLPHERERAIADLQLTEACVGEFVCHAGRPVTYWLGLVDGLLKMSADNVDGMTMTFTGVPPGGWFGEGTCIKSEPYRYNIQALRKSVVAGVPLETFHWLLDNSLGAQLGGAVQPRALPRGGCGAAHHPARAGLLGRPVTPTCERGLGYFGGAWCHPCGVRRAAGEQLACFARRQLQRPQAHGCTGRCG